MKGIIIAVVAAIVAVIVISAVTPEKDCAGNNTYRTAEVCRNGK